MNTALSFRDVRVEYGEKIVLERIDLDIAEGSFVAVMGPSGAGKSTFLHLVLGDQPPTGGRILLDGQPLAPECGPDRGVVFQRYSVFPHLTALGNVMFGLDCAAPVTGRLFGARREAAREQAAAMLDAVGLGASLDIYPAQMSGGMQQRLAIAQALIMRPRILLLDEPFGALDPGIRRDMHELIGRLWREQNLTVLMVTHDLHEGFALGTRVIMLDKVRHDPHAPHRFGATIVHDLALDRTGLGNEANARAEALVRERLRA